MFELTMSLAKNFENEISNGVSFFKNDVEADGGLIAKHGLFDRVFFSIAVPENKREFYKSKVLDFVTITICKIFKYPFFEENLKFENGLLKSAFLNAISVLDNEFDYEEIRKNIIFSNEILIDSFFYFKLQTLKSKWEKTASAMGLNCFMSKPEFLTEMIYYLAETCENKIYKAKIFFKKDEFSLLFGNEMEIFKKDNLGKKNFFSKIVLLNPQKIEIESLDADKDVVFLLEKIFKEKINFL